jgi:hypothetical protein
MIQKHASHGLLNACWSGLLPLRETGDAYGWMDWLRLINEISRINTDNKLLTSSNVNVREPNRARRDKVHGFANLTRQ